MPEVAHYLAEMILKCRINSSITNNTFTLVCQYLSILLCEIHSSLIFLNFTSLSQFAKFPQISDDKKVRIFWSYLLWQVSPLRSFDPSFPMMSSSDLSHSVTATKANKTQIIKINCFIFLDFTACIVRRVAGLSPSLFSGTQDLSEVMRSPQYGYSK